VHAPLVCDDQVGGQVDEQPMFDDSGSIVQESSQLWGIVNGREAAIEDVVGLIGLEWSFAAAADNPGPESFDEPFYDRPCKRNDFHRKCKSGSQFRDHLGSVDDDDLTLAGTCDHLLAQQGASTALDEIQFGINLVGTVPDASRLALRPGSTLHLYGKSPRPGRKLGHVNVRGGGPAEVRAEADRIGGLALAARGDMRHED